MNKVEKCLSVLASVGLVALLYPSPALAQVAPPAGVWQQFGALGNSGVTGSTGLGTAVSGDVGSSPTPSVTNFPPSTAPGFIVHLTNDLVVQQARADALAAYNFLAAQGPGVVLAAQLNGAVLTSGIYSFAGGAADLAATGTLTLNGPGIFIFQVASALTANVNSNVIGTANPCNVYWRVGTSATLNGVTFRGNVIADASIAVGASANVTGRVLAGTGATGAVTMAGAGGNTVGGCATAGAPCNPITLAPLTLPGGTVGTAYSQTITASGGTAPYTFAVISGAPPTGLGLASSGPSTALLSGTPTTAGSFNFTVRATDSAGCSGDQAYAIVISCPTITLSPSTLPNTARFIPYNQQLTASGSTGPFTFSVTGGSLPSGITLSASGLLSGQTSSAGAFTVTITATDPNNCAGSRAYPFSVAAEIPTLSEWGLILLTSLLALVGFLTLRKQGRMQPG